MLRLRVHFSQFVKRTVALIAIVSMLNGIYLVLNNNQPNYKKMLFRHIDQSDLVCAQPHLELWPKDLKSLFQQPTPITCNPEPDLVYISNGRYYLTNSVMAIIDPPVCRATQLLRGDDDFSILNGRVITPIKDGIKIPSDFSEITCVRENKVVFSSLLAGIRYNKTMNKRVPKHPAKFMSILIVGFDSVSRMTWLRNLPQTHNYFTSKLGGIVLEGYNIVGDGTPQALLPILTGKNETELPEARREYVHRGANNVDGHPWIWKEMHKQGFVTQWAEDGAQIGTFTFRMLGFRKQPVDHYMRTFYMKAESLYNKHRPFCLGSKPRHVNMFEWALQFFEMYQKQPKFSLIFHSELSLGKQLALQLVDLDLLSFLKSMETSGYLDRTVLILMSDHGARYQAMRSTLQGKYEERLPYFGIRVPPFFKQMYSMKYQNLLRNKHRLTTPFDIHETLLDIIGVRNSEKSNSRATSVFKNIPKSRTCADAHIEPHWCACLKWEAVNVKDKLVELAAQKLVFIINEFTRQHRKMCDILNLESVLSAAVSQPNEKLFRYKKSYDRDGRIPEFDKSARIDELLLQIAIETSPNNAKYEATIKYKIKTEEYEINKQEISRINKYGDQPYCIQDKFPHMRPYCYCHK